MSSDVKPRSNAAAIGAGSAACGLAAVLGAAWLLYRRQSAKTRAANQPAGWSPVGVAWPRQDRLPSGGFALREGDVTYELDAEGQPRILGEGTFGQVNPVASHLYVKGIEQKQ